jgi:type IV secretion system protein VirB6
MPICPSTVDNGIVTGLVSTVDCHIRVYVQDSYRNLVGPDTVFAIAFTGMLTIYIALFGYQMLLGRGGVKLTDLPVMALKIGLILAFLTSWAAYQTVFFNLLFEGPRELLSLVLSPMAQTNDGFNGDVYGGVEASYRVMTDSAAAYAKQAGSQANLLQGGPALGSGLLWFGAITILFITAGLIIAAKIVLGLLLALGPVFIGFFLFDTTRGLFDGWLRTTIAFAFTPLAVHVFGAGMLLMMQPFLEALAQNVARGIFDMGPIMTLSLIVAVFAVVMLQALSISTRIAGGFSSPRGRVVLDTRGLPEPGQSGRLAATSGPSRAAEISAQSSREELREQMSVSVDRRSGSIADSITVEHIAPQQRLGQAYQRVPKPTRDTST